MNGPEHLFDPNWGGDIHANRSLESNHACRLDGVFGEVNRPGDSGSDYGWVGLVEVAEKHADGDYPAFSMILFLGSVARAVLVPH